MREYISKATTFIYHLSKKEFQKYLLIFLGSITLIALSMVYYVWSNTTDLVNQIKRVQRLSNQSAQILSENESLKIEQTKLKELFEKEKDFNIKVYFEQFYKQQKITPETGWNARTTDINDNFSEVVLQANFKNQTMQSLVTMLDALNKKPIVYVKDITVRSEQKKRISFSLKIGTIRYKKS